MPEKRIAIVDDEEDLRENLRDLLEYNGYSVVAFDNGEDLLEVYASLHAHLVLLDYQLPGINGIDLTPRLKEIQPYTPVVLVTASSQKETLILAEQQGVDRFLIKPYSHQEMLTVVEEMLATKSTQ